MKLYLTFALSDTKVSSFISKSFTGFNFRPSYKKKNPVFFPSLPKTRKHCHVQPCRLAELVKHKLFHKSDKVISDIVKRSDLYLFLSHKGDRAQNPCAPCSHRLAKFSAGTAFNYTSIWSEACFTQTCKVRSLATTKARFQNLCLLRKAFKH